MRERLDEQNKESRRVMIRITVHLNEVLRVNASFCLKCCWRRCAQVSSEVKNIHHHYQSQQNI